MSKRTKVAVIGYGAIGRHHARNLAQLENVEFVGVVDEDDTARAEAAAAGFATFASIEGLAGRRPNGVVVSVPTSAHQDVALRAIDLGYGVLIEKPIATTVDVGEQIIESAHKRGVAIMIGYVERYNPAVIALRQFMQDGGLGKIFGISARRLGTMPARIKDANVLVDIGVHDLDMAAFLLDSELQLRSAQGGRAILNDRVDYAFLALEANGVPVHIETNWITPVKIREVYVSGEHGYCHVDYIVQTARFAAARDFSVTNTFEGVVEQYSAGSFTDLPFQKEEPLRRELRTFVAGIEGSPLPDPRLALVSLRIAEEATRRIELHSQTVGALP
jgi:UDP-N-acetylglucosamine 3-dehydrogenase